MKLSKEKQNAAPTSKRWQRTRSSRRKRFNNEYQTSAASTNLPSSPGRRSDDRSRPAVTGGSGENSVLFHSNALQASQQRRQREPSRPGAYAVPGPLAAGRQQRGSSDYTVTLGQQQTTDHTTAAREEDSPIMLDASLAPEEGNDDIDQNPIPLLEATPELPWFRKRRNQAIIALIVVVAIAIGVVLGIVLIVLDNDSSSSPADPTPTATQTPTASPAPTMAPTTLSWTPSGTITGSAPTFGIVMTAILSLSNGSVYQFAISDGSETQVWQQEEASSSNNEWRQLGQNVPGGTAVSLTQTQLIVDQTAYQFVVDSNEWTPTGLVFDLAGVPWDVDHHEEMELIAVESIDNKVQRYRQQGLELIPVGQAIPTLTARTEIGNPARRMGLAAVNGGTNGESLLLIESTLYILQDNESRAPVGVAADDVGTSSTISQDGSVIAVADDGSNVNGRDSGQVQLFFTNRQNENGLESSATLKGDSVDGRFGQCLSLSYNGQYVAILANDEAQVFHFAVGSSSWSPVASALPAGQGGSIEISQDGRLVAISGGGRVQIYWLESES